MKISNDEEIKSKDNLGFIHRALEERFGLHLSTGIKMLVNQWFFELENSFLSGKYGVSKREEKALPIDEIIGTDAYKRLPYFVLKFFPDNSEAKRQIEDEQKRAEFIAQAYLNHY